MAVRRVLMALLGPVEWAPPGIDPARWRSALAEDVIDLIATLTEVTPAIAATAEDLPLAEEISWPGMRIYRLPERDIRSAFAAAAADGYDQAAVIAADAPDVPGLILAKLLRPLTTRPVSVAAGAAAGPGLLGVAARLPAPDWLPEIDLDRGDTGSLSTLAPRRADVAVTPAWRRLREAADFGTLDPAVEGWDNTRALLGG